MTTIRRGSYDSISHIDLFSGIGGFALASSWVWGDRYENVGHAEIEEYPCKIYHRHFPGSKCLGDITKIEWEEVLNPNKARWHKLSPEKVIEAIALYASGESLETVAQKFGVSRQSMWALFSKRNVPMRPRERHGEENHFYRGGPRANDNAQNILEQAIEDGKIAPEPCEVCGEMGEFKDGRRNVQAHHDDYNKPLEVRWLCQKHHHEWHKSNTPIARKEVMPKEAMTVDLVTAGFP